MLENQVRSEKGKLSSERENRRCGCGGMSREETEDNQSQGSVSRRLVIGEAVDVS
jgi:hypothetical protein